MDVEAEYGERKCIIPVSEVWKCLFQFALVNNVINYAIEGQFELPITNELEVSMVYSSRG